MTMTQRLVTVPAAADMDTETFCLHMALRHEESLGGLSFLDPTKLDGTEHSWRVYHDRLHELRQIDMEHDHARPSPRASTADEDAGVHADGTGASRYARRSGREGR